MLYNVRTPEDWGRVKAEEVESEISGRTRRTHVILMVFYSQSCIIQYNIGKWDLISISWMICPSNIRSRIEWSLIVFSSYNCRTVFRNISLMPLGSTLFLSYPLFLSSLPALCFYKMSISFCVMIRGKLGCFILLLCGSPPPLQSHIYLFDLVAEFFFLQCAEEPSFCFAAIDKGESKLWVFWFSVHPSIPFFSTQYHKTSSRNEG